MKLKASFTTQTINRSRAAWGQNAFEAIEYKLTTFSVYNMILCGSALPLLRGVDRCEAVTEGRLWFGER
jgi:hypothetical protein